MALFEREDTVGSDAASRALSVTAVENDFVERVYDKIAKVYDLTFGPTLHPGRLIAPVIARYEEEMGVIRIQDGARFFFHDQTIEHNTDEWEGKLVLFSLSSDFGHNTSLRASIHYNGLSLFCQFGDNFDCLAHGKFV